MNLDVFPAGWAGEIASIAEAAFLDVADIERPASGPGTLNRTTGDVVNPADPVESDVPCRAQWRPLARPQIRDVAGEQITLGDVQVEFARGLADLRIGDLVTLTTAQDARLDGRTLRVVAVTGNTLHATRVAWCALDATPGS